MEEELLEKLMRANALLASGLNFKALVALLVEETLEISGSDLGCIYLFERPEEQQTACKLYYKKGKYHVPEVFVHDNDFLLFIRECKEAMIVSDKEQVNWANLLLHPKMQSGMIFPLATSALQWGLLFLNALEKNQYTKKHFSFLNYYTLLAGEKLYTTRLIEKIKAELTAAEELNSFQEAIISVFPQLLLILDPAGNIRYYNTSAKDYWQLLITDYGRHFREVLKNHFDALLLDQIQTALEHYPCTISLKLNTNADLIQNGQLSDPDSVMKLTVLPFHKQNGQTGILDHNPGTLLFFNSYDGKEEGL